MNKPINAWAFYRRSTDKQELSIEDQRKACHEYATKESINIIREFQPAKGYGSGLTIDRDPVFLEMVQLAKTRTHNVSVLLAYDVSRFGRLPTRRRFFWEETFKECGIRIRYVTERFLDDDSISDDVQKALFYAQANDYSKKLSEVVLRGSLSRALQGFSCGGSAPYGLDRIVIDAAGNRVSILLPGHCKSVESHHIKFGIGDPTKVAIVQRIFSLRASGNSLHYITTLLNKERVPSPEGGEWTIGAVRHILQNQAYIGRRVYNRRNFGLWRREEIMKLKPDDQIITVPNAHEAIIDEGTFNRVQTMFKKGAFQPTKEYKFHYLLAGLLRCKRCGNTYHGNGRWHTSANKKIKKPYYQCGTYHSKGKCGSYAIAADYLEGIVLHGIQTLIAKYQQNIKQLVDEQVRKRFGNQSERMIDDLKNLIKGIQKKISHSIDAIQNGFQSESLRQGLETLEHQRKTAEKSMGEAQMQKAPNVDMMAKEIMGYIHQWPSILASGNLNEKKTFIRGFVAGGSVDPEQFTVEIQFFRLPFAQNGTAGIPLLGAPGRSGVSSVVLVAGVATYEGAYSNRRAK